MNQEKGQTLLIVVLVMVIALTVSLFLVSRTITNLRNSNEQANSQKAFSAAEAGVEEALQKGMCSSVSCSPFPPITGSLNSNSASFSTTIDNLPSVSLTAFLFNNGNFVAKDDGVDLWLVAHKSDGLNYNSGWQNISSNSSLTFYWGSSSDSCPTTAAALEIIVLYEKNAIADNGASVQSTRYAYDPCSARRGQNGFITPNGSGSVDGKLFNYSATVSIPNNSGILARVVPLYVNTSVGVSSSASLPNQGNLINSIGTYGGTSGKTTRTITVFQGYSEVPSEFFPYVLFAPAP